MVVTCLRRAAPSREGVVVSDLVFLDFTIPGKPRAWMRTAGYGKARFERKEQKTSKGVIQVHTLQALRNFGYPWPLDWNYRLVVASFWPVAKSQWRKKIPRRMRPRPSVPDWDNLGKLIGDALEGILWQNDSQIVDGRVVKFVANQGEAARTEVRVWGMRPDWPGWAKVIER
jgi:Holliday junction resolvase RusA-like endonuclease